ASLLKTYQATQGNISQTSRLLGLSRNTIYRKLKALGILKEDWQLHVTKGGRSFIAYSHFLPDERQIFTENPLMNQQVNNPLHGLSL
ncbi:helix-turn-helix domain-containing protein, partial [Proteus terrae]|uniref:helix-turn-helix domain-containing protein n=1 Tax=Proteus terrae TaxID=1574161 RepID=UPI00301C96A9